MILAGDIGGTHTRIALFEPGSDEPRDLEVYPSDEHAGLGEIVEVFLGSHPAELSSASFGVAGPVDEGRVEATNLPWIVDAAELTDRLGFPAAVLNDLEANAWGVAALGPADLVEIQAGEPEPDGVVALVSAGTGLGEAYITPDGVHASEGGHVDFGPRGELQRELLEFMQREHEHVSFERVCSGIGIVNCFRFVLARGDLSAPAWFAEAEDKGTAISKAALDGTDDAAAAAIDLMVAIYGAQAGNVALTLLATGGVYLGGGIPPRIVPRLREGPFLEAFNSKGRLSRILERTPVHVIDNDLTALLGAARHAGSR